MNPNEALTQLLDEKVEFLLLQFTDIMGSIKTVEIPANKFEVALAGEVAFDGSALEGFRGELGVSPLPVFVAALSVVAREHPWVNASWAAGSLFTRRVPPVRTS